MLSFVPPSGDRNYWRSVISAVKDACGGNDVEAARLLETWDPPYAGVDYLRELRACKVFTTAGWLVVVAKKNGWCPPPKPAQTADVVRELTVADGPWLTKRCNGITFVCTDGTRCWCSLELNRACPIKKNTKYRFAGTLKDQLFLVFSAEILQVLQVLQVPETNARARVNNSN